MILREIFGKSVRIMKSNLSFALLSMVFVAPLASAKSELETLRSRCLEQERQIRQLEEENTKLRSETPQTRSGTVNNEPIAAEAKRPTPIPKPISDHPSVAATYTVKAGDNIHKIARKTETSVEKIAKLNGIKTNSIIQIGQILKLPQNSVATAPLEKAVPPIARSQAPAVRSEMESTPVKMAGAQDSKVAAAKEATPAATPARKIKPITVDGEITYGEFASKHNTDTERLNALNGLDLTVATVLAKGSELYVPNQQ